MAAKAHEELYAVLREEGWAKPLTGRMQTRAELYETLGYHDYEALDSTIAQSIVPTITPDG
jgi:methylisocitrate lyase